MKASLKDYLTIVMAFAAIFLAGYGIGHIVGGRNVAAAPEPRPWEEQSLSLLQRTLELDEAETAAAEREIAATSAKIRASRHQAVLEYHRHLDDLYGRLIPQLGGRNAERLSREKRELERQIEILESAKPTAEKPIHPTDHE